MKISGIQKFTLIDYPGKTACTLFFYGCNFKCGFCHNPELVILKNDNEHKENDVLDFLRKRKKYLDAVCITGGEPLLTLDIEFIKKIKSLGYLVKIDTNGSFPEKLKKLIELNLVDYIAMDIKGAKEDYKKITNSNIELEKIEESIRLISNFKNYEFRTTILEKIHSENKFKEMMGWLALISGKKMKNFSLQGFKNLGKLIDKNLEKEKETSENYLKNLSKIAQEYFDNVEIKV